MSFFGILLFVLLGPTVVAQDFYSLAHFAEKINQIKPSQIKAPCESKAGPLQSFSAKDVANCIDPLDNDLTIDPNKPVMVLIHGINAPPNQFEALSKELISRGIQPLCFRYDDRKSLDKSAEKLSASIKEIKLKTGIEDVTLMAHSLGTFIARRALVEEIESSLAHEKDLSVDLITISAPFAGIRAARSCSGRLVTTLTLGINRLVCMAVSGRKWYEISENSHFIQEPGTLGDNVQSHLKIMTDEKGTCRSEDKSGKCIRDDFVFTIDEQRFKKIDQDPRVQEEIIRVGHGAVIQKEMEHSDRLIQTLIDHGPL